MDDRNGHGTHVAGTAAGNTYGVSFCNTIDNSCRLCAIKVLNGNGSGTWGGVAAGIDKVATDCQNLQGKCVLNMSLGGGPNTTVENAVKGAVAKGVTVVVAAGNSNADACNHSPARVPEAITVGSTTKDYTTSSFSNYGPCVDTWQPGSAITSAWRNSDTSTNTISGTSMAAPREYHTVILPFNYDNMLYLSSCLTTSFCLVVLFPNLILLQMPLVLLLLSLVKDLPHHPRKFKVS